MRPGHEIGPAGRKITMKKASTVAQFSVALAILAGLGAAGCGDEGPDAVGSSTVPTIEQSTATAATGTEEKTFEVTVGSR